MTMHTCDTHAYIPTFHTSAEIARGVNGTWPPRKAAAESGHQAGSAAGAVLARLVCALAGAGA